MSVAGNGQHNPGDSPFQLAATTPCKTLIQQGPIYSRASLEALTNRGGALPENNDASAAYHYEWRNVCFELSQTQ